MNLNLSRKRFKRDSRKIQSDVIWRILLNLPENWSRKALSQAQNVETLAWITTENLNILASVDFWWNRSDRFLKLTDYWATNWKFKQRRDKKKKRKLEAFETEFEFLVLTEMKVRDKIAQCTINWKSNRFWSQHEQIDLEGLSWDWQHRLVLQKMIWF